MGGKKFYTKNFHDSMALIREYGKADTFITKTMNPRDPAVVNNLFPGQQPWHRPDLLARVFKLKLQEFLDDMTKRHVTKNKKTNNSFL
jgi:hypothetical protein